MSNNDAWTNKDMDDMDKMIREAVGRLIPNDYLYSPRGVLDRVSIEVGNLRDEVKRLTEDVEEQIEKNEELDNKIEDMPENLTRNPHDLESFLGDLGSALKDRLVDLADGNEKLQEQIELLRESERESARVLVERDRTVQSLADRVNELRDQLADRMRESAKRESEILSLNLDVSKRDEEINVLEKMLDDHSEEISSLEEGARVTRGRLWDQADQTLKMTNLVEELNTENGQLRSTNLKAEFRFRVAVAVAALTMAGVAVHAVAHLAGYFG